MAAQATDQRPIVGAERMEPYLPLLEGKMDAGQRPTVGAERMEPYLPLLEGKKATDQRPTVGAERMEPYLPLLEGKTAADQRPTVGAERMELYLPLLEGKKATDQRPTVGAERMELYLPLLEGKKATDQRPTVGAERMELYLPLLEGKKVGLVVNATAQVRATHLVDTLVHLGVSIGRIFTPEHGFSTQAEAGAEVSDHTYRQIPVRSLYGAEKKPSLSDISELDLLVFDLQDVGARFYTYSSTLHYVMEAVAEADRPLIVLDRPNPNGDYVDGPICLPEQRSFVGMHPLPIVHGLTVGELATMINGEAWLKKGLRAQLKVILIQNWTHRQPYVPPIKPSPNLPTYQSVRLYPSLCLFEGTVMSIGRGTETPFEVIGYPDSSMGAFSFVPRAVSAATRPKHMNLRCYGRSLREVEPPRRLMLEPLLYFYNQFKEKDSFFLSYFEKLAGTPELRKQIEAGYTASAIRASWQPALNQYKQLRSVYLLYPD